MKRLSTVVLCLLTVTLSALAQPPKPAAKKSAAPPAPDHAYLQKIWDGWSTLDPANVAKFYATGPHVFFDIAPLKYANWDEYAKGVTVVLSGYKSAKCRVNNDAVFHQKQRLFHALQRCVETVCGKGNHQLNRYC